MARRPKRDKRPPRVSGAILIVIGVMLLLAERIDIDQAWPLVLILVGVIMIVGWAISGRKPEDDYSAPPPPHLPPPPPPPISG